VRISEILKRVSQSRSIMEMASSKKDAEFTIRSLRDPINEYLVKLATVSEHRTEDHWRKEITNWLVKIAGITLKPNNTRLKAITYYNILYHGYYDPNDIYSLSVQIEMLSGDYVISPDINLENIILRIKNFHIDFSQKSANGEFKIRGDIYDFVIAFGGLNI